MEKRTKGEEWSKSDLPPLIDILQVNEILTIANLVLYEP